MVETQHAASLPKLSSEAVSEIQAVAFSMSGRELEIVMHEIEVRFGSQIDGLCQVKPQGCAYVSEKVIAAHVVGTGQSCCSSQSHRRSGCFPRQFRPSRRSRC